MTPKKYGLFVIPFIAAIMIGSLVVSTDLSYSQTVEKTTFIPDPAEPGKFVHAGSGKKTFDATTFKHIPKGDDKSKFSHAGTTVAVDRTTFIPVPQADGTVKFVHAGSGKKTFDATTFKHIPRGDDKSTMSHASTPEPSCDEQCGIDFQLCLDVQDPTRDCQQELDECSLVCSPPPPTTCEEQCSDEFDLCTSEPLVCEEEEFRCLERCSL